MTNNNYLNKEDLLIQDSRFENEQYNRFSTIIFSIRAISIFLILVYHIGFWFASIREYSHPIILMIYNFGNVGIDLFFVLSGMMLVVNLINRDIENHSWIKWYKRRILRIYPAYWLMLMIIIVLQYFLYSAVYPLHVVLINLSGFQSIQIYNPNFRNIHFIYWYMSAILTCYLLFPIMFYALRKNFKLATIIGIILFILYIFVYDHKFTYKIAKYSYIIDLNSGLHIFFVHKYFVFYFGMVFGYWIGNNNMENVEKIYNNKLGIVLLILLIVLISIFVLMHILKDYHRWLFPYIAIVLIPFLIFAFNKYYESNKHLTFFGERSFEIYLIHRFLHLMLYLIFYSIPLIKINLLFDLIILPIFLLSLFIFAIYFKKIVDKNMSYKNAELYIIPLVLSVLIFTLIFIFLNFNILYYHAFVIYIPILLVLYIIFKKKILQRSSNSEQI